MLLLEHLPAIIVIINFQFSLEKWLFRMRTKCKTTVGAVTRIGPLARENCPTRTTRLSLAIPIVSNRSLPSLPSSARKSVLVLDIFIWSNGKNVYHTRIAPGKWDENPPHRLSAFALPLSLQPKLGDGSDGSAGKSCKIIPAAFWCGTGHLILMESVCSFSHTIRGIVCHFDG